MDSKLLLYIVAGVVGLGALVFVVIYWLTGSSRDE